MRSGLEIDQMTKPDREAAADAEERLRGALGDPRFAELVGEGSRLSREQSLALAREVVEP
jgi:hypothetical protein